jgi:ATP/maltotriose-dependent transcriptional regulator MalT
VLFECLTGQPAFPGTNFAAVLAKVLFEQVPEVRDLRPEVSEALSNLVAQMLAKEREYRPRDGGELASAFEQLVDITNEITPLRARLSDTLTKSEQKLLSVVFVARTETLRSDGTTALVDKNARSLIESLNTLAAPLEGEFAPLANHGAMVMLKGYGNATDQAVRAAAYALAVHNSSHKRAPMSNESAEIAPSAAVVEPGSIGQQCRFEQAGKTYVALATGVAEIYGRYPVGRVIDKAAELLDLAINNSDDTVYIDDATARLIESRYEIGGQGPARRLLNERPVPESARRMLLGRSTPCVGRQAELTFLEGILGQCIEEPEARAVLIIAPAGFGKTRLCYEFIESIQKRSEPIQVLTARGDPVYSGSAFLLAAQLVRRASALCEGDPRPQQYAALCAHIKRLVDQARSRRVCEFLGELVKASTTEEPSPLLLAARNDQGIMYEQLRCAFEDWVGALCKRAGPLVLVLDDLHWGDLPTVTFIDSALRKHAETPIMLIGLARPGVMDKFPQFWSKLNVQEIQLKSLKRRAAERLAREVLGERIDDETIERIVQQAEGNAFFLEELIRQVAETGGADLPQSVVAIMQTRLEGLDRDARRILRAASVFGEVFWEGGVQALLGDSLPAPTISQWLDVLVEREMLYTRKPEKFPRERTFEFRHGLYREAAYAMLTENDRALGHRLGAVWLEKNGEKDPLALADHFEKGSEKARAIGYFVAAAQAAYDGGNYDAVLPICDRAIDCGAQGPELGEVLILKTKKRAFNDDLVKVPELAREALGLLPAGSPSWFTAVAVLSLAGAFEGRLDVLADAMQAYQSYQGELPANGPAGQASYVLYGCMVHSGRGKTAQRLLDRLNQSMQEHGVPDPVFRGYLCVTRAFSRLFGFAHLGSALGNAQQACALFQDAHDRLAQAIALYYLAWAQMAVGHLEASEETCVQAIRFSASLGFDWGKTKATLVLGSTQVFQGHGQAGIETLRPLLQSADSLNRLMAEVIVALAHCSDGNLAEAERHARLVLQQSSLFPTIGTYANTVLARVAYCQGCYQDAVDHARRALETREQGGMDCVIEPMLRLTLAEALYASGDGEASSQALRGARDYLLRQADALSAEGLNETYIRHTLESERTLLLARQRLTQDT